MFYCKGMKLANYLIENGMDVIRIESNYKKKGYLIFVFEDNENVAQLLAEWKNNKYEDK